MADPNPPPTYKSVVRKLNGLVGDRSNASEWLSAIGRLTPEESAILHAGAIPDPMETPEKRREYNLAAAQALSTDDIKQKLEEAGNAANAAARDIDDAYASLQRKIEQVDRVYQSNLAPQLIDHRDEFRKVLDDSRKLAAGISQYGAKFDDVIIKFCADKKNTRDQRLEKINKFIDEANEYQERASKMKSDFQNLTDTFVTFVGEFSSFAEGREGELTDEIKQINKDLSLLHASLDIQSKALISLGITVAVLIPIIAMAAAVTGGAAFIFGGLGFFTGCVSAIIGLAISLGIIMNQIQQKEGQRRDLEAQIERIRQARQELVHLGEEKYKVFSQSIASLASCWTHTIAEAEKIKKWLEGGEEMVDYPEYMEMSLGHGVKIYESLSLYLDAYARDTA